MKLDCEWNPQTNKPLTTKEIFGGKAHAKAVWFLGGDQQLAVCEECVNIPELAKKYKIRKRLEEEAA
jgi:hypothetical protein